MTRPPNALKTIIAAGLLFGGVTACREQPQPTMPAGPSATTSKGPLTLRIDAAASEISTLDDLSVTVTIALDPGYAILEPSVGDEWGPFTVLGERATAPSLTPTGGTTWRRTFDLEPFLPGTYTLPSLEFAWEPLPGADAGEAGTLSTGEVEVRVTSVLDPDEAEIAELRGPMEPLKERHVPWTLIWVVSAASLGTTGLLVTLVLLHRRFRQQPSVFGPALARADELKRQLPEYREHLRDVWHEAGTLLTRCASEHLEPHATSMGAKELLRCASDWYGIMESDRHRLTVLLTDLERVRFQGEEPTEEQTRLMLAELTNALRALRGASDLVVHDDAKEESNA